MKLLNSTPTDNPNLIYNNFVTETLTIKDIDMVMSTIQWEISPKNIVNLTPEQEVEFQETLAKLFGTNTLEQQFKTIRDITNSLESVVLQDARSGGDSANSPLQISVPTQVEPQEEIPTEEIPTEEIIDIQTVDVEPTEEIPTEETNA